ncbi:MAG TPA: hypothetical protein VEC39_19695, partial [Vicinamibacterales bacterium]|nr:hypothetical protein [Vicinamibacterales bacterium]
MKFALVVLCVGLVGCGRPAQSNAPANATASAPAPFPESSQQNSTRQSPRIVFLGDSLTAGLGLPIDQSYPSLIDKKLKER